jgi:hypothetical protein
MIPCGFAMGKKPGKSCTDYLSGDHILTNAVFRLSWTAVRILEIDEELKEDHMVGLIGQARQGRIDDL